ILKIDPSRGVAVRRLAECEKELGQHERAMHELRQLVQNHQSSENFKMLGDQLYSMSYFQDALEAYFHALSGIQEDGEMLFEIGRRERSRGILQQSVYVGARFGCFVSELWVFVALPGRPAESLGPFS